MTQLMFARIARPGRQAIDRIDLEGLFVQLDPRLAAGVCQRHAQLLLSALDANGDGIVSYEEFCHGWQARPQLQQFLCAAFNRDMADNSQLSAANGQTAAAAVVRGHCPAHMVAVGVDDNTDSAVGEQGMNFSVRQRVSSHRRAGRNFLSPGSTSPLPPPPQDDREMQALRDRLKGLQDQLDQTLHLKSLLEETVAVQQEQQEAEAGELCELQAQAKSNAATIKALRADLRRVQSAADDVLPVQKTNVCAALPSNRCTISPTFPDQLGEGLREENEELRRLNGELKKGFEWTQRDRAELQQSLAAVSQLLLDSKAEQQNLQTELQRIWALRDENNVLRDMLDEHQSDLHDKLQSPSQMLLFLPHQFAAQDILRCVHASPVVFGHEQRQQPVVFASPLTDYNKASELLQAPEADDIAEEGSCQLVDKAGGPWSWLYVALATAFMSQYLPRWGILPHAGAAATPSPDVLLSGILAALVVRYANDGTATISGWAASVARWAVSTGKPQIGCAAQAVGWPM